MEKETYGSGIENERKTSVEESTTETNNVSVEKGSFDFQSALMYEKGALKNGPTQGDMAEEIAGVLELASSMVASRKELNETAGAEGHSADSQG